MFAYCGNNPANRTDPTGTWWWVVPVVIAIFLSGCESESEPYSGQANCYAYALKLENDPNTGKPFKSAPNPGDFSTSDFSHYVLYYSPQEVYRAFDAWIQADAKALGYTCFPVSDITDYTPTKGNWLIAVAYDTSPSSCDYHFWRQDTNGTWSHKPGAGKIKYVDQSGNTIYDPMLCDRGRYEIFLGYYEIGPN